MVFEQLAVSLLGIDLYNVGFKFQLKVSELLAVKFEQVKQAIEVFNGFESPTPNCPTKEQAGKIIDIYTFTIQTLYRLLKRTVKTESLIVVTAFLSNNRLIMDVIAKMLIVDTRLLTNDKIVKLLYECLFMVAKMLEAVKIFGLVTPKTTDCIHDVACLAINKLLPSLIELIDHQDGYYLTDEAINSQ